MKKYLCLALLYCSYSHAHEPYVAPLSYMTENTQIPVIASYAEQAFNAEHALKQVDLTVIQPDQSTITLQNQSSLKSASTYDLSLPQSGTYRLFAKTSFPLKYVEHNKTWKMLFDMPADKAKPMAERDYAIPSDFKKAPAPIEISREWTIQSYISKDKTSDVRTISEAPLQVAFKTHPNNIVAQQAVDIAISKSNKALNTAEVVVRAQGQMDKDAQHVTVHTDGTATLNFPHAGQFLIEVSEKSNPKAKPMNQYYSIISVNVLPVKAP